MRTFAVLCLLFLFVGCSEKPPSSTPEAKPAAKTAEAKPAEAGVAGTKYGAGISLPESISIAELQANVDKYEGKEVRIEGLVTGVCPKRGCWFDMAGEKAGESMRFKVKDGVMVFPMEANGKYAVAQGVVRKMPKTLEQSKQWAAYQKKEYGADLDPESITEPITIVRLDGSGAMIRDAK
ncbi:MAG: DUF4920 domain-containing protein [Myxococcota bacterium]|nr:DUF4920 domain-containing protein [Myxococcota bacterium]